MENPFDTINQRLEKIEYFLSKLHHINPAETVPESDLLNINEAAQLLNLARATVYNLVSRRALPAFKKSGRLYFSKTALIDWIKSGKRATLAELADQANQTLCNTKKGAGHA